MESVQSWAEIGSRIAQTRESAGLSQGELASRIGVDRTAVVRMEQGERKVSALELFRIAETLDAPPAHFLTQPPAALVSRRKTLDSPADAATRDSYRLDIRLEEHARNAEWLVTEGFLAPPHLDDLLGHTEVDPTALAREARRVAGIPPGPLGPMASVAERFGLYLTVVPEPTEGASLLLDSYGVSVISGHSAPGRRRWTAAHELGHHLLRDEYHSDAGVSASRDEREQAIDDFAGEFLLPEDEFDAVYRQAVGRGASPREALIGIAADYRLSWSSTVSRARWLGLVGTAAARHLKADTPVRGDFLAVRGAEPVPDLETGATGTAWRQAVLAAWKAGAVSAARTVELLYGALQESELPEQDLEDVGP
ncbi:helix-turn-helix domain-containing protein [Streptomyces sp. NPDC052492]|uniref:helix-turn-helix domain-containing protein n=1 Tax=Streptomyces sp. NPDC052492 TaxID=3365691 RepID=UPI0037D65479